MIALYQLNAREHERSNTHDRYVIATLSYTMCSPPQLVPSFESSGAACGCQGILKLCNKLLSSCLNMCLHMHGKYMRYEFCWSSRLWQWCCGCHLSRHAVCLQVFIPSFARTCRVSDVVRGNIFSHIHRRRDSGIDGLGITCTHVSMLTSVQLH